MGKYNLITKKNIESKNGTIDKEIIFLKKRRILIFNFMQ